MESPKNSDERIESGQGPSVCQEQPVVDDLVFQRSTSHLKPAEHTSTAIHEHFSFEEPIGKVQATVDPARLLLSVDAERDTDPSFLAGRDFIREVVQIEVLPLIEDGLTVGIGRVAIDEVPPLGSPHGLTEIQLLECGPGGSPPPHLDAQSERFRSYRRMHAAWR